MPYIGTSPSQGVRRVHTYTATASQTTFTGAGAEGATLSYKDSNFVDVYQNGVKLGDADYTATSGTSIVLGTGATASDLIVIVAYDVFSVADTVSKADGGTFDGNVTMAGTLDVTGNATFSGDIIKSTSGTSNFAAGVSAGSLIGSGANYNTFVGDRAGRVCSSGDNNVAIGFESLDSEIGGGASVAVGYQALLDQNTSNTNYNTAVGFQSGKSITSSQYNTIVGGLAADALTTGNENTAIGVGALGTETAGDRNVAVGNGALTTQNTTGGGDIYNTAVGYNAGTSVTTGVENTIIGGLAGDALTTGNENVAVGLASLGGDTQGKKSVAVGWGTLTAQNFTSATDAYNTAIGYAAGNDITSGIQNTLIGSLAGQKLTDADFNVAIGINALTADTKGNKSVAIGDSALGTQNFTSSTDAYNVAIGYSAGLSVTTGVQSVYIGGLAGDADTSGGKNVYIGYVAGTANVGDQNVFIGRNAGGAITNGDKNTIIGTYDGNEHGLDIRTSDNYIVLSDGDGNPRIISDNSGRVGIGRNPLSNRRLVTAFDATGSFNFEVETSPSSGNVYGQSIYFSAQSPDNNSSEFLRCRDNSQNRLVIYSDGDVQNHDNSYGAISDIKLKEQITDASSQWEDIKALTVRKYKMKSDVANGDSDAHWRLGVVAQEVETAGMGGLVAEDPDMIENEDGEYVESGTTTKRVKYSILYMKAVKALQEAMTRIETLEAKVATLEG